MRLNTLVKRVALGPLGLALIVSTGAPAEAADSSGRFAAKGIGGASCAQFVEAMDKRAEKPQIVTMYGVWLDGYLTRVNERLETTYDVTPFASSAWLLSQAYANCKRQPEQRFIAVMGSALTLLYPSRLTDASVPVRIAGKVKGSDGEEREVGVAVYAEVLRRAQTELKRLGHYAGEVDGKFGPQMKAAIAAFQEDLGVQAHGLPDQIRF